MKTKLVVPVNNTIVCSMSFLAADTLPCVLIKLNIEGSVVLHCGLSKMNGCSISSYFSKFTLMNEVALMIEVTIKCINTLRE